MKSVKPLLLICGALMAIASLIGTIDYSQASNSGKLKNLYKDERASSSLIGVPLLAPVPIDLSSFSRAPFPGYNDSVSKNDLVLNRAYKENKKSIKRKNFKRKRAGKYI